MRSRSRWRRSAASCTWIATRWCLRTPGHCLTSTPGGAVAAVDADVDRSPHDPLGRGRDPRRRPAGRDLADGLVLAGLRPRRGRGSGRDPADAGRAVQSGSTWALYHQASDLDPAMAVDAPVERVVRPAGHAPLPRAAHRAAGGPCPGPARSRPGHRLAPCPRRSPLRARCPRLRRCSPQTIAWHRPTLEGRPAGHSNLRSSPRHAPRIHIMGSGSVRLPQVSRVAASGCVALRLAESGVVALGLALDLLISLTGRSQMGTIPLAAKLPFCRLIGASRSGADGRCRPELPAGRGQEDRAAGAMVNARPGPEADTDRRRGGGTTACDSAARIAELNRFLQKNRH